MSYATAHFPRRILFHDLVGTSIPATSPVATIESPGGIKTSSVRLAIVSSVDPGGLNTVTFSFQGSFDGVHWLQLNEITQAGFTNTPEDTAAVRIATTLADYRPYYRLVAEAQTGNDATVFQATLLT